MTARISFDSANASTERSIPERFEKIAKRHPDRLAVKHRDQALSYESLNAAANRVAHGLLHTNGSNINAAALLFEQGIDIISAILGTLKTGARYCALDAEAPEERIEYILNDFQTDLILTNSLNFDLALRVAHRSRTVINIDEIAFENSSGNPGVVIAPDQIAAVVYTSGSTGHPRGVVRTHQRTTTNVVSYGVFRQLYGDDRISLTHSVSYSSGDADLLMGILNGAAIFPFSVRSEGIPNLAEWLKKEGITVFHSAPSVFRELTGLAFPVDHFSDLRLIRLSGAPITQRDFDLYRSKFPARTRLEVGMGSTEAAAICNAVVDQNFSFPKEGSPVGYAREGKKIFIIDENGQVLPAGAVGEIAVKSRDFSLGYWRQPDLTETKYLRDSDGGDEITYFTGDLGTMLSDGFVIHLGRKDLTVKIRGYRVDISEVERALLDHPGIKEAGVTAWERESGEKYLVGYIVCGPGSVLNVSEVRNFLDKKLPSYMIPSAFMFLESLPLTNGKIDRTALLKPDNKRPELSTAYVGGRNEFESRMVSIWEEILDVRPIGIDDNFFELGGHSLSAARLFARLDDEFGQLLPLSVLVSSPTVRLVVESFRNLSESEQFSPLVPFSQMGTAPAIFAVPGVYGNVVGLSDLCREVGSEQGFYGLQSIGLDGTEAPLDTIEDMARRYVAEMRKVQPSGPYILVGACFGAGVTCEMAYQLLGAGEEIGFLGLLDPIGLVMSQNRADSGTGSDKIAANDLLRSFVTGRLKLYCEEMRGLDRHGRVRFIANKIISLGQKLRDRKAIRAVRREMHQLAVFERSKLAGRRYHPKRLTGRLRALEVFFSAHPHGARIQSFDWSRLWEGKTVLHRVPGKDSGDMLSGDNARVIGALLRERLRAVLSGESATDGIQLESAAKIALLEGGS